MLRQSHRSKWICIACGIIVCCFVAWFLMGRRSAEDGGRPKRHESSTTPTIAEVVAKIRTGMTIKEIEGAMADYMVSREEETLGGTGTKKIHYDLGEKELVVYTNFGPPNDDTVMFVVWIEKANGVDQK